MWFPKISDLMCSLYMVPQDLGPHVRLVCGSPRSRIPCAACTWFPRISDLMCSLSTVPHDLRSHVQIVPASQRSRISCAACIRCQLVHASPRSRISCATCMRFPKISDLMCSLYMVPQDLGSHAQLVYLSQRSRIACIAFPRILDWTHRLYSVNLDLRFEGLFKVGRVSFFQPKPQAVPRSAGPQ